MTKKKEQTDSKELKARPLQSGVKHQCQALDLDREICSSEKEIKVYEIAPADWLHVMFNLKVYLCREHAEEAGQKVDV